jgi:hypothetical protein
MAVTYLIPSPKDKWRIRPIQDYELGPLLGRVGDHWPTEGMQPRTVEGMRFPDDAREGALPIDIRIWINPSVDTGKRKSSAHRAKCECPGCGRVFSVGRLAQHKCKKAL